MSEDRSDKTSHFHARLTAQIEMYSATIGLTGLQLLRLHIRGLHGVLGLVAEALAVVVLVLAGLVQGLRLACWRDWGVEVEHLTTRVSLWSEEKPRCWSLIRRALTNASDQAGYRVALRSAWTGMVRR